MAGDLPPELVDAILLELESGMKEAFYHSVENAIDMKVNIPARDHEDILFVMAMWARGDATMVRDVLKAVATTSRGQIKSAWARSLWVVASELFAMRERSVCRLRAIVEAELAAAPPIDAAAIVLSMGERPEICAALLGGYLAESSAPIAICSNGRGEIGPMPGDPRIIPPPSEEYHVLKEMLLPAQRLMIDFYRALSLGDGDVLLFEDDTRICHGWAQALDRAKQATHDHEDPGFIWLMEAGEIETPRGTIAQTGRDTTTPLYRLPPADFIGMQALWIPAASRRKIRQAVAEFAFENYKLPIDLALRAICRNLGLGLFATGRALVQHMKTGEKVTPGFHHRATHLLAELY
jgi:hypothetical protein